MSPDGKRIAFVCFPDENADLCAINVDGTGLVNMTESGEDELFPKWSPDGKHIVFETGSGIGMINADGTGRTNITHYSTDAYPDWSPDSKLVVFSSSRDGYADIWTVHVDGTNLIQLTESDDIDAKPSWSPDGTRIAFYSNRNGGWDIYVMNVDGTGITRLTNHPAFDGHPCWSKW